MAMQAKKSLNLVFLSSLLVSTAALAAEGKAPTAEPSAQQIVTAHLAARGGLQSWRAVQSMSWTGKLDVGTGDSMSRSARYAQAAMVPSMRRTSSAKAQIQEARAAASNEKQVQLPFVFDMERPHKSRLEVEFAGKTAVQVYDGTNGWKLRPFLNRNDVESFTQDEARSAASKPDLDGPLVDYAAKGTTVALDAVESVDGHDAYKLKLTLKNGDVQHIWIDKTSHLDVKIEGTPRRMDGKIRTVWVYQRDFRRVDGVMVPFAFETVVDGYPNTHKMVIEKVVVNPKFDNALFTKPKPAA
jgi:hypothetical protein